jgi:1-phosphofructokinase family hexose kinase
VSGTSNDGARGNTSSSPNTSSGVNTGGGRNPWTVPPAGPFLVVGFNPTLQTTMVFETLQVGEVNRAVETWYDVAGKGLNVARVLSQLGEEAVHLTHLGGPERERFLAMCERDGIDVTDVPGGSAIRTCTTVVDRQNATATELIEPASAVTATVEQALVDRFCTLLERCNTVVLAGSLAPGYTEDLPARLTSMARRAGLHVFADYRGVPLQKTLQNPPGERPNILKINLVEFAATFFFGGAKGLAEHTRDEEVLRTAQTHMRAVREMGIVPIVTRGREPALYLGEDGGLLESPPLEITAVNAIGSGDSFAAGLLHELAAGGTLDIALERAHAVAAMNASNIHPGSIRPHRGGTDRPE